MKHGDLTDRIIRAFYKVYNTLEFGFLEKVYQNALYLELLQQGFKVEAQRKTAVFYFGKQVGEYYADLLINELIILELKAHECLLEEHELQLINYLKATEIEVGLLLNFGKNPKCKEKYLITIRRKPCSKNPY